MPMAQARRPDAAGLQGDSGDVSRNRKGGGILIAVTIAWGVARMYPEGIQHLKAVQRRNIEALGARYLEYWDGEE